MSKLRPIEWLVIVAIFLIVAIFFAGSWGSIHHFSPDTLESTYQTEFLSFGMYVPLYRSATKPKTSKLVDHLVKKGYWRPRQTDKPTWICTGYFNEQWRDGQSQIHKALYWHGNVESWIAWSDEKPQLAAEVWPRVLMALRQGGSIGRSDADELLLMARFASTLEELDQLLHQSR